VFDRLRTRSSLAILAAVAAYEPLRLPGLDGTGSLYAEFERDLRSRPQSGGWGRGQSWLTEAQFAPFCAFVRPKRVRL